MAQKNVIIRGHLFSYEGNKFERIFVIKKKGEKWVTVHDATYQLPLSKNEIDYDLLGIDLLAGFDALV